MGHASKYRPSEDFVATGMVSKWKPPFLNGYPAAYPFAREKSQKQVAFLALETGKNEKRNRNQIVTTAELSKDLNRFAVTQCSCFFRTFCGKGGGEINLQSGVSCWRTYCLQGAHASSENPARARSASDPLPPHNASFSPPSFSQTVFSNPVSFAPVSGAPDVFETEYLVLEGCL